MIHFTQVRRCHLEHHHSSIVTNEALHLYSSASKRFYTMYHHRTYSLPLVVFQLPSVRTILANAISQNSLREFVQLWHKCPLGLNNKLNLWWSKVNMTATSQNKLLVMPPKHILHKCITWWCCDMLSKRSTSPWDHTVTQNQCSDHKLNLQLKNSNLTGLSRLSDKAQKNTEKKKTSPPFSW